MDASPSGETTPVEEAPPGEMPNLVSSRLTGEHEGLHALTLDIDHEVTVVPSTTPGHYHLYVDVPMAWEDYGEVMEVLAMVGIIGPHYARHALERGESCVRMPWVRKSPKPKEEKF